MKMEKYLEEFFSMGVYAYVVIAIFILAAVFSFVSIKMNKNALTKWLAVHPNAVKIELSSGNNVITQKQLYARVISGEAAIFNEKAKYIVCADPGDIVLEVTYTYTRPGVLHKNVTTTWGPAKVEFNVERGKDYLLSFDKKEEQFKLSSK
ncbi:hypothetical protein HMPREF0072_2232 [Anaerococcus lactolyticus ATCC 51172]|uniref:Uncharacterized protein n=2 Tax=Anaerococcus lactolyticus TaxID=33032 RepID=C2BIR2_9FIRM|nr:hypothetical protein [Anaerococcus lactolyticus]EEI85229.1 hypothetical protein HMPREF0072_2232 [Anaerococcus lactolyticus ATCC 51172]